MNEYVQFFTEKVVELISNIAWPLSILIILLIIKKPLLNSITRIKKVRYADFEAEMAPITESLSKFREKDKKSSKKQLYDELLFDNPNFAIIQSWIQFENFLQKKYNEIYSTKDNPKIFHDIVSILVDDEKIPKQFLNILHKLKFVRNQAVHSVEEFSVKEAKEFIENVNILQSYIEKNL